MNRKKNKPGSDAIDTQPKEESVRGAGPNIDS